MPKCTQNCPRGDPAAACQDTDTRMLLESLPLLPRKSGALGVPMARMDPGWHLPFESIVLTDVSRSVHLVDRYRKLSVCFKFSLMHLNLICMLVTPK